jgi:hypothetical protein
VSPWVATGYIDGPSMARYVAEAGPLGEQGAVALATRMAEGLVALHAAGLVHGDLTPSTVLLADDGPRVIDLGMPRADAAGSPEYLSPEQVMGQQVGTPTDVFALASLTGFAATGRYPFAADSPTGVQQRIVEGEPDIGPIDGRFREVLLACLSKDPRARPTAAQLRDVLSSIGEPDPGFASAAAPGPALDEWAPPVRSVAPPLPTPARRRQQRPAWVRVAAIIAAVVLGVGIVLAAVLLYSNRDKDVAVAPAPLPTTAVAPPSLSPLPESSLPVSPLPVSPLTPPPLVPSPTVAAPTPTAAVPDPAAGATLVTDGRFGAGQPRFAAPSRNIACQMTADGVRCDVVQRTWKLPPAPPGCQQAFGTGAVLAGSGLGALSCAGDTVADPALKVLAYGEAVQTGSVVCVSRETGMRCTNAATGHGFQVARAAYELF